MLFDDIRKDFDYPVQSLIQASEHPSRNIRLICNGRFKVVSSTNTTKHFCKSEFHLYLHLFKSVVGFGGPLFVSFLIFDAVYNARAISSPDISCNSRLRAGANSRAWAVIAWVSFQSVAPPESPSSGLLTIKSFCTPSPSVF